MKGEYRNKFSDIINDIENRVNDIINLCEEVKGVTEVDNIKEELKKLADDLY